MDGENNIVNECPITENRRSVKDVIPESRLARFYGKFYYDEERYIILFVFKIYLHVQLL